MADQGTVAATCKHGLGHNADGAGGHNSDGAKAFQGEDSALQGLKWSIAKMYVHALLTHTKDAAKAFTVTIKHICLASHILLLISHYVRH